MKYIQLIFCCAIMIGSVSTAMAQDIQLVMKVTGVDSGGDSDIDGKPGSEGWFKIDSYASGLFNPASVDATISQSKTAFNALTIQMPYNALVTELMQDLAEGVHTNTLIIEAINTQCVTDCVKTPYKLELKLVMVERMNPIAGDPLKYEVVLLYGAFKRTYLPLGPGGETQAPKIFTWSRVKNKPKLEVE